MTDKGWRAKNKERSIKDGEGRIKDVEGEG